MQNFWKAILWTAIILYLTLSPSETFPEVGIINFDKFVHLIIYYMQTFLFITAFYRLDKNNKKKFLVFPFIIGLLTGIGTELLQGTELINRDFDLYDMLANTLGSILVIFSFKFINKGFINRNIKWL